MKKNTKKFNQININISLIFLFILIEIFGLLNIWNENIYRRIIHHMQSGLYNKNKKPWIVFPNVNLFSNEIKIIKECSKNIEKKNSINSISSLPPYSGLGGHYSNKSSLYYNDFDKNCKQKLDVIGNRLKEEFEKIINKKLYLSNSNFRCCILRYEGIDSLFNFHYDTEENNCYRCIYLFHKNGNISPFCYFDENGVKHKKNLNLGEGLFFKGRTTYHGVEKNSDENSQRYIVGWQYSTDLSIKTKSFCSELRDKNKFYVLKIIFIYFIIINILIYIWTNFIINVPIKLNYFIFIPLILFILFLFLPKYLPNYIGTGLYFNFIRNVLFLCICLLSSINTPQNGLLLFSYLIFTEMFLPNSIIAKTLN